MSHPFSSLHILSLHLSSCPSSFHACSSHLMSLLSSSVPSCFILPSLLFLSLILYIWSHIISPPFLQSLLFYYLPILSHLSVSQLSTSHFITANHFSFYLCPVAVSYTSHLITYFFLSNILFISLFSSGFWQCIIWWVVTSVLEDVLPLWSVWKC